MITMIDGEKNVRKYEKVTLEEFCELIHAFIKCSANSKRIKVYYHHGITILNLKTEEIVYYKRYFTEAEEKAWMSRFIGTVYNQQVQIC